MKISNSKINFYGHPVAWDLTGKTAGLLRRRDLQSIGFAVAASEVCLKIGIFSVGRAPTIKEAFAVGCFIGAVNLKHLIMSYIFEEYALGPFSRKTKKSKVIETNPDKFSPATIDKWGPTVARVKSRYNTGLIAVGTVSVLTCGFYLLGAAPLLVRQIQGRNRWLKVERGEWRIEDKGPPPEPVKQNAKQPIITQPAYFPS